MLSLLNLLHKKKSVYYKTKLLKIIKIITTSNQHFTAVNSINTFYFTLQSTFS